MDNISRLNSNARKELCCGQFKYNDMNVCLQDEVRNMVKDYNPVKVSLQVKEDRTYVSYPHVLIAV